MASSYGLFHCKINGEKSRFSTPVQLTLGGILRDTQFTFRKISDDYHQGFSFWEIEQERKVDELIIVAITNNNKTEYMRISEYIVPETLNAYYLPHEILIVEGSIVKRNYAYKQIREHFKQDIEITEPLIDINELIHYVEKVEKANIQKTSASVRRITLIGESVSDDILFDQLLEEGGQLKSVRVSFQYRGTTHRLNVSENGGIFLIGRYESVSIQLEVIKAFYEEVLKLNKLIK